MTEQIKRKSGGGKLSRSETVTVRLDPKLRYLAELAARRQRRTLSSYIEWAIEDSLTRVVIYEGTGYNGDHNITIIEESSKLWDVDEPDRFARLALHYPDLLTHDEQVIWKLVRDNGHLWRGRNDANGEWMWQVKPESLIFDRLCEHWPAFLAVARGETGKEKLPGWQNNKLLKNKTSPFDDLDGDIPF